MERSSFFNSNSGDRKYQASDFAEYFNSFITNGCFPNPSTNLQVMANNNMTVTIKAGKAWINGYIYINDNDLILPISVADGVLNRIDRIVVQFNTTDRTITAKVKKGTFASTPVANTLQRDSDAYELGIADIYIAHGAVSISQVNITDLRLNTTYCGVVNSLIQVDTTSIFNQYQAWFSAKQSVYDTDFTGWTDAKKTTYDNWYGTTTADAETDIATIETNFQANFNTWFDGIKNQLGSDVAGGLLTQINAINSTLNSGVVINPTLSYGMNSKIKMAGKTSVFPSNSFKGLSYINVLGKDGNCEDITKWIASGCTLSLDSTNKVFDRNSMKITLTATGGSAYKTIVSLNLDITKYYFISAYLKNGNATNIRIAKDNTGGGNNIASIVTDATKFNSTGIVVAPTDFNASNLLLVSVIGASTNTANVDGIMAIQITAAEYALGVTALLAKYPYGDSYVCLRNPYEQIIHDNLVRNGNGEEGIGWWNLYNTAGVLSKASSGFSFTTTGFSNFYQVVNVKPNTSYYIYATGTNASMVNVTTADSSTSISTNVGTFNTSSNSQIRVGVSTGSAGTYAIGNIMLIEGTIAPTTYLPFRQERQVIEGLFTSDDSVTVQNGKITGGQINWKHKTLFGKDYALSYSGDYAGYKELALNMTGQMLDTGVVVKYDGKITRRRNTTGDSYTGADNHSLSSSILNLTVADGDTGWGETTAPNNTEVLALMNGWKAIYSSNSRYVSWYSIVDSSIPGGAVSTTTTGTNAASQAVINVVSTAGWANGDWLDMKGDDGIWRVYIISTVNSATQVTMASSTPVSLSTSNLIFKCDNGTTTTSLLIWCANNVAPNYPGYQLHYKLANPEVLTDDNTHLHGDIPKLDVGDNYVYLDSGMVLGEIANPTSDGGGSYVINNSVITSSMLKYKSEVFTGVYKNLIDNGVLWVHSPNNPNGKETIFTTSANFDIYATYTVDYKILATQAPQIGTTLCNYSEDVFVAVQKNTDAIEGKQQHDSSFDNLLDLSMSERLTSGGYVKWSGIDWVWDGGGQFFIQIELNYTMIKKTLPAVTINSLNITFPATGGDITNQCKLFLITVQKSSIKLTYFTNVAAVINSVKTYGVGITYDISLECRGKV